MFFSVIIPLFNKENEILNTLDSVLRQSFQDFEIIIIDDGSTDTSLPKVTTVQDERLRWFSGPNKGVCSARNRGIKEAKGNYIALLDADDTWDPNYLLEQRKLIDDFPECAMWGINFAEVQNGNLIRELPTALPKGYRGIVQDYFHMPGRISDLFCSSSVVIRKDVFEKIGFFDERLKYSEDVDMWWRIIANYPVAFYDRYMVFYNYDASNRAMKRERKLKYWLPYYPEKYKDYKGNEPFYTWVQRWCAINLKKIYFNDNIQKDDASIGAKKLDFSVLPIKYKVYFKSPYILARLAYFIKH